MFDPILRTVLEHYATTRPSTEDHWYGPWISILTTLFPTSQGYLILPQRRITEDSQSPIRDFVIEVAKLTTSPFQLRTVLVVKARNNQHWQAGIPRLEQQIRRQTDTAFGGTAAFKVYWIGVVGPHWRYGVREENEQDPKPLIDWRDTIHDEASYDDLQRLTALIADM